MLRHRPGRHAARAVRLADAAVDHGLKPLYDGLVEDPTRNFWYDSTPSAGTANGSPAFGQYKPSETGSGFDPWSLQVVELTPTGVGEITFFLDTQKLFPLFGLPLHLDG